MQHKKALLIPSTIFAITAFGPMPTAFLHDGVASGTCNGGVQWAYSNYEKTVTNTITVTIDGVVRYRDLDFKASDAGQILTDKTVGHTWSVVVNAPGTQYDHNPSHNPLSGSYPACVTVAPTTTVASSTTVVTTTTTVPSSNTTPPSVGPSTTAPTSVEPTTTVVAVDIPPVPTPAVTAPPSSPPTPGPGIPCVQDAFGNWVFQGTQNPCSPPTDVVSLTPAEPVLPRTGLDGTIVGLAVLFVIVGFVLVVRGRRVG